MTGWWLLYLPLWKRWSEFVSCSWDDDIPNMMGQIKAMFQTTNQMTFLIIYYVNYTIYITIYQPILIYQSICQSILIIMCPLVTQLGNSTSGTCPEPRKHVGRACPQLVDSVAVLDCQRVMLFSIIYPLVMSKCYWKWPLIVSFPIKNGNCP